MIDKREIARRMSEAQRLLDEPLLVEALDRAERITIEELLNLPDEDDRGRRTLADRARTVRGIRQYLRNVIVNGEQVFRKPLKVA